MILPGIYPGRLHNPIVLGIMVLLCLMAAAPDALYAADRHTTAQSRPSIRGREERRAVPGPTSRRRSSTQATRPRLDFWAASFNHAQGFDNLGIDTFFHKTIMSKKINFKGQPETEIGYTIYLPPDYASSQERYPVIYFLHGLGANENTVSVVVKKADELIKSKESLPFIIAAINGGRTFYGNQYEGKCQVHDFFFEEFIPHVDATYRTKAEKSFRHTMGFSMGGYGATLFATKHPDMFGAFTDIAGALIGARFNYFKEMHNSSDDNFRPYDIYVLMEQNKEALRSLSIAIWVGSEDICRAESERFHQRLTDYGLMHEYNDWIARPKLDGVEHNLARYFELYGTDILRFHTDAFGTPAAAGKLANAHGTPLTEEE